MKLNNNSLEDEKSSLNPASSSKIKKYSYSE